MDPMPDITADALAIQERDGFRAAGWRKVIAPAKVNLYLAIGEKLPNGYHGAHTVLHALSLHDTVYLRRKAPDAPDCGSGQPVAQMTSLDDVPLPPVDSQDNLAARAVRLLAERLGLPAQAADVEVRIEKVIPFQAGLGGASADAAAALVGFAGLIGPDAADPAVLEATARELGADVAFFLHGGCAYLQGVGDEFVHGLEPLKGSVALVKPAGGVSTAQAYDAFDASPQPVPADLAAQAAQATRADEVPLFNNLAPAAQGLMPALGEVEAWLKGAPGVQGSLLCGSGACSFALCEDFAAACAVVGEARKRGWWARATSFSSARAMAVGGGA